MPMQAFPFPLTSVPMANVLVNVFVPAISWSLLMSTQLSSYFLIPDISVFTVSTAETADSAVV